MTQHTQSSFESVIFITHVEADDIYLKIWGQLDKQAATSVEHYIYPLIEQFNQGYGCPSKLNRLAIGTFCCARFQSDGYYRAKILGTRADGMIVVQFIDYGNVEVLPLNEIRLWDNIREMEPLRAFPPMAYEFSLMNVLPINGVWDKGVIEEIKKILCYNEFRAFFHMMNNRCFIKLWYNNEDFSELLVKQQLALSTTLPTTVPAIIPDMFRPKHVLQPQILAYQQQNKSNMNNCATMPIMQNPNMNHNSNVQGFHKIFSTDTNQHKHVDQRPSQPPPVQEALVFKSRVLDVNSQYQVLISHVEDGPQKFSVQVESTQAILTQLMDKINSHPKQPLQEPPLPGSVCLGRYRETAEDGVLCRAVVMSVMEHKCKLYYVDFGHTEVLPYTDIFQLPPEYINPKVLSIRFTLSGLRELNITQEMKAYFKELVYRKLLILHVRPPEGPPLIQYGDLYDNGVNIKDMLKKAFPAPAVTVPITYSYPQLQRLSKDVQEVVHVSYVESCKKFFVQLDNGTKSLDSIMTGLAQYAKMASVLNTTQLKAGLPCAALYDSQWYRAQILSVTGDKVKVVYVDYGNEEVLPTVSLRTIHDDLVTSLPAQAIKCALNGYEVLSLDQEVSNHFERLTLEKLFYMKVVAAQPKGLLVDLFEFDTMRSIHPQLLNNLFCDKNSTSTPNGEIQHPTKSINNFQSGSKDRFNKKSNVDTWNRNQNTKPYQDNKPNSWRDERSQQYDNRHDRIGAYSHHDGLQNDRSIKNEIAHNKFGRDKSYHKHDKNEINTFNRSSRETSRNNGNKFNDNERRYNRNNSDKVCSDKDSDTSSKGSGKRTKYRDGFNNGREESYDSGISNKSQTGKWSDRKPSMARKPSYKSGKFTGDYNSNEKFKDKENNTNNVLHDQINTYESWDTDNVNKKLENNIVVNRESQFSPINVTLGSIKNCEVVFINSPLDFFVQLNPDCIELDTIMENIAATYENNGKTMQVSEIQCGTCCIAQYSEDLKWYRVVIKSVEKNSATVEFVDYGNTESVDFTKIKVIQEKFLKLPMQAVRCKLLGLTSAKENEHTIFSENVEGKLLEIEFVAEKNGVYEVLLRKIINDIPNINYINEKFCTMQDLTKAKETMAIEKTFKAVENIQEVPDYAPIDSKWQTTFYESGSEYDAIVTWFINPNKLYCQLLAKETEFKAIMSEIQKTYTNRKPVTDKLQIGSAVIAIFAEDRALYRAEVINTSVQKDTYVVQYIDFGNCAIVNLHNIYPVEKKFMQLPKLAIQCSLKNIVPNNNSDWSKTDNNALDNCFNADKYKCIFHDFSNNQYTISLIHNGQDVGDMLVQKNLATFVTKTSVETICGKDKAPETSDTEIKMLNDVERMDISLLNGQILKMKVSNVESVTLFHVQLLSASKYEKIIHNYMADKNTEVMPRLSTSELCLDAGCLINVNGTWKRAVVINCSRSKEFYVKLIDTGMCQKILDGALALPGELAIMQNQALECSLQNVIASSDADKRLKEFVGKEILVMVEEVNNNRLIVKLYDLLGNGIMNTEEKVEKILPIYLMPILSSTHLVFVSYLENPTNIWLQRYSEMELDAKLLKDLEQYYCNSGQKLKKPEINLLCAAKCLEDGNWYRGKIISYTETTACVHYIDYGNTEEIALESIMILEPQFYEPHQLAINVSLSITLSGTEDEQLNLLQTHLINKEFTAVFYNVHKKWIVDLIENGEKLSDKFRLLNLVLEEQTLEQTPDSQTHETPTVNKFNVYVSHVDSPSQFWLQRVDELTSLNEKQEQLQLEVSNFPTINGILEEGTLCVATYSIDNLWYRAEVLDGDEEITTVRFIDYGNTDVVDNTAAHIRQIPDAWKSLERFALKCRLDVIPVDTEDWNESTCERFEHLVTSTETVQALIIADTMPKRVELFINDKSVSEMLVEEKLAIMINTEQEPVDEIVDLELDPHSAFVCHSNSPNEFWVQEEKSVADLEVMADRFIVADMFPKIDDVKEDLLCVAKYPDDEQWYRARVISHDNNGNTQVIYIDYGNSAVSTEIRAIPEDLAIIPPLSRKCCLQMPPQIKEWSEQACEEFFKLAADGATIFLLDVLKEQEVSLVKLTLEGQNVADILASMCEQHLPVIEERLPPLGEENSPNVVVSHINSPNEFWIQAESSISELEVMSDRLRDAESFLALNNLDIGTICAARYPEDGYWYRAKIIAHCETGTEVLYMDYGNSAVTEELRILPEDIVNIPILSKRCTLEKPSHIATWSEEACDKFKELAAEGATMFQFENLDEDDPMHVRLNLNGTSVVDLLLATVENIPPEIGEITEKSPEEEIISITKGKQAIIQEDHELVNNSEETSNLDQETQEEQTSNQIDNLDCVNQVVKMEKNENETDEEVFNKSFINSDINEGNECNEEQQKSKSLDEIEEKKNEKSEITVVECTSKVGEISEDIVETNKDVDNATNEAISNEAASTISCFKESLHITELSVDEIVGSMLRDTIDDIESRIDHTNLSITNEMQLPDIAQIAEQQELLSQTQDINNSSDTNTDIQILEVHATRDDSEATDKIPKILPVTNELQFQDVVQLNNNQDKEQKVHVELQLGANEPSNDFQILKTISLQKEKENLEQRQESPTKSETIPESIDNNNDLEIQSKNVDTDNDFNISSKSTCMVKTAQTTPCVIKTDSAEQHNYSRRRSEDKTIPECVSKDESPSGSRKRPVTPKTPHSEKLVAGAVNPFVQSIPDNMNEEDEILTVSVENNIPKYMT